MPAPLALIAAWARSPVAPLGGALRDCTPHTLAAPVVQALLSRAGVRACDVDAVVVGNALGAGGNPARLVALAAGLPEATPAWSIDTQCCSGLDAVSAAAGLLATGQASVVVAGGVEAWSRAPIRHHRPQHPGVAPQPYERPAFVPDPSRDPEPLSAAAEFAAEHRWSRIAQDAYALASHAQALAHQSELTQEIVPIGGLAHDSYPRALDAARAARLPATVGPAQPSDIDTSLSPLAIATKADGAAFVLLMTPAACERLRVQAPAAWTLSASAGGPPQTPLLGATIATRLALQRAGLDSAGRLGVLELHDAFAVQGLAYCQALGLAPDTINRRGGGLARGHPIGASGAIALVRTLADLTLDHPPGTRGLACVAGVGGIGSAALVERR